MRFKFNIMGRGKKTIKSVFNQNTKSEVKKEVKKPKQEFIPFEEPIEEKELILEVETPKEEEKELVEQPLVEEIEDDVVIKKPKLRSFGELSSEELRLFDRTGILPRE